jgi:prophage regulatory protein
MHEISSIGFYRLSQILGDPKAGIPAILPISKSSWWNGIKTGRYPAGRKLSARTTVWAVEDIRALIESVK